MQVDGYLVQGKEILYATLLPVGLSAYLEAP